MSVNFSSITFSTCNEKGDREVKFELERTLLDRIFKRPAKVITLVQETPSSTWYEKGTGKHLSSTWDVRCLDAIEYHRQNKIN